MSDQQPEGQPRADEAAEPEKEEELVVGEDERKVEKKRRRLLALLLVLVALLLGVTALACRYFQRPAALPDLVPLPVQVNLPPHYLFSIYGVDKPVGVAAHPSPGWEGPTVVGGLAAAGYRISTSGAAERQGVVHRLDAATTGVMVVAKSERACRTVAERLRQEAHLSA